MIHTKSDRVAEENAGLARSMLGLEGATLRPLWIVTLGFVMGGELQATGNIQQHGGSVMECQCKQNNC